MDVDVDVHTHKVAPSGGGINEYRHWSVRNGEIGQTMLWTLSPHRAFAGAVTFDGAVGALGQIHTAGYGGVLWFGSSDAPAGEPGGWRYDVVPPA